MRIQHDLIDKEGIIRIPGFSSLGGFYHYSTTRPDSINGKRVIRVKQIHSDNILVIDHDIGNWELFINSRTFDNGYDALITDQNGVVLEIRTADCLPILIIDPNKRIIAAVHAGWRGSLLNLAEKVIIKMKDIFGSNEKDLFIGFGPCIRPCCYEVGIDVLEPVRKRYPDWTDVIEERGEGKGMFDLEGFNKRLLLAIGVRDDRISSINLCTSCYPARLPSYRRDGLVKANIHTGIMIEC